MRSLFVITILLAACAGSTEPVQSRRAALLDELRKCREVLPLEAHIPIESPCANRDVAVLAGVNRVEIETELGRPDSWVGSDGFVTLDQAEYAHSASWGYSFHRLPLNSLGGGPELLFEFNANDEAKAAWVQTQ